MSHFDGERFETLSTGDGLTHAWVSALAEDDKGRLWIGTEGGGANRYDGDRLNDAIGEKDGLADNRVSASAAR